MNNLLALFESTGINSNRTIAKTNCLIKLNTRLLRIKCLHLQPTCLRNWHIVSVFNFSLSLYLSMCQSHRLNSKTKNSRYILWKLIRNTRRCSHSHVSRIQLFWFHQMQTKTQLTHANVIYIFFYYYYTFTHIATMSILSVLASLTMSMLQMFSSKNVLDRKYQNGWIKWVLKVVCVY